MVASRISVVSTALVAISAATIVSAAIIVLVTVAVSPVVTTVPVVAGKVMVASAPSVIAKVVSKSSAVSPSNTNGLAPATVPVTVTISPAALPKVTAPSKVVAPVILASSPIVKIPPESETFPNTSKVPVRATFPLSSNVAKAVPAFITMKSPVLVKSTLISPPVEAASELNVNPPLST